MLTDNRQGKQGIREMTAARIRARRGARFLDEVAPGWENRIDLETLSLNDGMQCVCGQVFAEEAKSETTDEGDPEATETGYSWAADHLFAQANAWVTAIVRLAPPNGKPGILVHDWDELNNWVDRADRVATALGFDSGWFDGRAKSDQEYVRFDALQIAWTDLIANRKATANAH